MCGFRDQSRPLLRTQYEFFCFSTIGFNSGAAVIAPVEPGWFRCLGSSHDLVDSIADWCDYVCLNVPCVTMVFGLLADICAFRHFRRKIFASLPLAFVGYCYLFRDEHRRRFCAKEFFIFLDLYRNIH